MKFITTIVGLIGKILSPSSQIQAVGGRRQWTVCVSMLFVLVAWLLKVPEPLIYAALVPGGLFVAGESMADMKGRGGLGIGDLLEMSKEDDEEG